MLCAVITQEMTFKEPKGDAPLGGVERRTSRMLANVLKEVLSSQQAFIQLSNAPQTERDIARVLGMNSWNQVERAFEELGETPRGQETIMVIHDGLNAMSQKPAVVGAMTRFTPEGPLDFMDRLRDLSIQNHPDLTRIHSYPPLTPESKHRGFDPLVVNAKHRALEQGDASQRILLADEFAEHGRFQEVLPLAGVLNDNSEGVGVAANKVVGERAARALERISWAMHGTMETLRGGEVDALLPALTNRNPVVRRHITYALGYFPVEADRQQKVQEALQKNTADRDPEVQEAAQRALALRTRR